MFTDLLDMPTLLGLHPEPVKCIIEDLLPVGGLSLLVAMPKAGKTTLARNLMVSVAHGTHFFGRWTKTVPVLYYELEEHINHVADEFRIMGAQREHIYIRCGLPPKDTLVETLRKDILALGAGLVVIDPLFDAVSVKDVNSYGEMNEALKSFLWVARTTNCHIMVLHHTNKRDVGGGSSVLGSQATAGATDHNFFLTVRGDGTRMFASQARVGRAFELTQLSFNPETHALDIGQSVKELREVILKRELLDVLGGDTLSLTEWRARVRGRNSEKGAAIHSLEGEGVVERVNLGAGNVYRAVLGRS